MTDLDLLLVLAQGSLMVYYVHNGLQYPQCQPIAPSAPVWYIQLAWVFILIAVTVVLCLVGLGW